MVMHASHRRTKAGQRHEVTSYLFHKQLQSLNNDNSIRIECLSAAQTHSEQKGHMTEVAAYSKSLCYGPLRDR